ncbi:MAG: FIVAR domain-containing protein, partial [Bacteroidales bacterium]|nr:FIVAR domain-containing protein [Bacteroidales bacterium]
ATTLTINYTGDQRPSQSGLYGDVSMYRINSPANKGFQIRAKGFGDNWFWGSGTFDRADMVFTFVEIDASLVKVFLAKFNGALESATALANSAQTDVTLGYPTSALNELMDAINAAQTFANGVSDQTSQEEIDAATSALNQAMTRFSETRIYTFEGFTTDLAYLIYSYGTHPNAGATSADGATERRYLYATKCRDGVRDSLVYRIGLSENAINGGQKDPLANDPAALWAFTAADEAGYVIARNQQTGSYLRIETTLANEPIAICPYYAKHDNGRAAFYMDATAEGKRLFNVGAPDANGKGGPLEFFAMHADRTRLRWVIQETDIEVRDIPAAIRETSANAPIARRYYNLQGVATSARPESGLFLQLVTAPDGSTQTRKIIVK